MSKVLPQTVRFLLLSLCRETTNHWKSSYWKKGEDTIFSPKALTVGNDFLRVAIARFKGYPKSLTYASGYTLNPNGGAEVLLPLNTKDIEIALQEQEYITAFLEVEYSNTDGKVITVLQTTCRVKNDLIDNAPTVELQEQFYDKVYVDEVFSKKSANLSDLADKAASRTNLGVYSKSETDAKDALALKKRPIFRTLLIKKPQEAISVCIQNLRSIQSTSLT